MALDTGDERFLEAIRKLLGAPEGSQISVDITGGGGVQIGDYTWDTEPTQIECHAWHFPESKDGYRRGPADWDAHRTFNTLPELFNALWELEEE